MSLYDDHLLRAKHNENLAAQLPAGYADWRITVAFYASVHYIEAAIVRAGRASTDHASRKANIRALPAIRAVATDYDTLLNYAHTARYRPDYDFNDPALSAEVAKICALVGSIKAALGIA